MTETILINIQIGAFAIVGSLVGEFYRYSKKSISMMKFMANFMASCFLSYAIAFLIQYIFKNPPLSYGIAAILAYQDEKYLNRIAKRILSSLIKNIDLDEHENNKRGGNS